MSVSNFGDNSNRHPDAGEEFLTNGNLFIPDPALLRRRMVFEQIIARGIKDSGVIHAMLSVPRHQFVPDAFKMRAYTDYPLPIGYGQTISQPYVVAYMTEKLCVMPKNRILEIGTGSGYQAAILATMGGIVFSVERISKIVDQAVNTLSMLGISNVSAFLSDGTMGLPDYAPFDRIIVTAGGPEIPHPLVEQLADPGIMVIPVGSERKKQYFVRVVKNHGKIKARILHNSAMVAFVDLVGEKGWSRKSPEYLSFLEKKLLELSK